MLPSRLTPQPFLGRARNAPRRPSRNGVASLRLLTLQAKNPEPRQAIYTEVNARLQMAALALGGPVTYISHEEGEAVDRCLEILPADGSDGSARHLANS